MNETEHNLWLDFCARNKNPLWRLDKAHHGVTHADTVEDTDIGHVMEIKPNKWHLEGTVYTHTAMVFQEAIKTSRLLSKKSDKEELLFSALAHDLGKPFMRELRETTEGEKKVSFIGHDYCSALMCMNWARDNFDEETVGKIVKVIALHTTMFKVDDISPYIDSTDMYNLLNNLADADNKGRFTLCEEERNPKYDAEQDNTDESLAYDKSKPWLTIMIGIPGSGKSATASNYGKVFSADTLLEEHAESKFGIVDNYGEALKAVSKSQFNWIEQNILNAEAFGKESDSDLVIDATNLSKKKRRGIVNRFKKTRNIRFVKVWRDFEDCRKSRDINSGKFISDMAYRRMFFSFSFPLRDEYTSIEHVLTPKTKVENTTPDNLDTYKY